MAYERFDPDSFQFEDAPGVPEEGLEINGFRLLTEGEHFLLEFLLVDPTNELKAQVVSRHKMVPAILEGLINEFPAEIETLRTDWVSDPGDS